MEIKEREDLQEFKERRVRKEKEAREEPKERKEAVDQMESREMEKVSGKRTKKRYLYLKKILELEHRVHKLSFK
jgi:hypothetical protein